MLCIRYKGARQWQLKKIPTLNDYLEYVDEHMTNEDNMQDKMQEWTLQEFQIYFGHDTTKEQDNE